MKLRKTIIKIIGIIILLYVFLLIYSYHTKKANHHKLVIIIPFRNRFWQLLKFASHIDTFLRNQNVFYEIYVINQVDEYRFNRASLINVGFIESEIEASDYIAIHDVDLLPINPLINYKYPINSPMHLTPPGLHPIYNYKTFLGGILLITRKQFKIVNGMSNLFWGWGREDDEFRLRLIQKQMEIFTQNDVILTGNKSFLHIHKSNEKRDSKLYFNQRILTFRLDIETGLNDLLYSVESEYKLQINNQKSLKIINVKLFCDENKTPYCKSVY